MSDKLQFVARDGEAKALSDSELLRRLLVRQDVACFFSRSWIDGHIAFVDVLNDSVLINHERRAIAVATFFVEDAIVFDDRVFDVAQQRECDSDLFGKFSVGIRTVTAYAENLSAGR